MHEEISFMDYWLAVDRKMLELFGLDTGDAGIEADRTAEAQEAGMTAEEFALWFGEKYGLTLVSEWNWRGA